MLDVLLVLHGGLCLCLLTLKNLKEDPTVKCRHPKFTGPWQKTWHLTGIYHAATCSDLKQNHVCDDH